MAVGGDMIEITFNHPTIGTGVFFAKANEDNSFDLGGYRSNDDSNMVDGGGNMIDQMNQVRWKVGATISWDMNNRNDLQKLVNLASSPLQSDWTFTHINGTVWGAKGKPVGDYEGAGNAGTCPLLVAGGGKLKKIVG